ncbi:MAG: hypothetical protein LBK59_01815 [Bifidobacteriaceae bacterium]|nr:hypothetical protein [Bifidobacteriaceae bacterium]
MPKSQLARHKQIRRLSGAQIEEMAEQYRNGKTVYELAPIFGVTRQTVGTVLRSRGVDTQNRRNSREGKN